MRSGFIWVRSGFLYMLMSRMNEAEEGQWVIRYRGSRRHGWKETVG